MGEQVKFAKFVFNDVADVKTFAAGKDSMIAAAKGGYIDGIQALAMAASNGDLAAAGKAQAQIAEVSEQLIALAQATSEAVAFMAANPPPPVPEA
jgi:hypothetical protein